MLKKIEKFKQKNTKMGFTLAEVLITLGIIGIVAAITIPSLSNKTNERELSVGRKKAYATLSAFHAKLLSENEIPAETATIGDANDATISFMTKYLTTSKVCNVRPGCWSKTNEWFTVKGDPINGSLARGVILNDGMFIAFGSMTFTGIKPNYPFYNTNTSQSFLTPFYVDVNGFRKPNQWGKDIISFTMFTNRIIPQGGYGDIFNSTTNCDLTATSTDEYTSNGCSAKALNDEL